MHTRNTIMVFDNTYPYVLSSRESLHEEHLNRITKQHNLLHLNDMYRYQDTLIRLKISAGFYYEYREYFYGF